ncbi:MAG: host-nuclease inhibitor Gam family protein [Desulfovibrionaceae bacterium]
MPKTNLPTPAHVRADALLTAVADAEAAAREVVDAVDAELNAVKARWAARVQTAKDGLKGAEKALEKHAKAQRGTLFAKADRVALTRGALVLTEGTRVTHAKTVTVAALDALGYGDGVRVERSVDWDAIEAWHDDKLAAIGTERRRAVAISYDLNKEGRS